MRTLTLNSLALHNFKGIRSYEATFSPQGAEVTGHNATGKSTLADAFSWLVRGKDAADHTEARFSLKTVDRDGASIPDLEHSVEGAFTLIDDQTGETEEVRFRRCYVEEWKTEAGGDRRLDGHHVDYFVNDIPVTKGKYDERWASLITPELLKVLTDPGAFFRLGADTQRGILMAMTEKVDPREIAATRSDFADLYGMLSGETLEDFRTKTGAQLKRVNDRLDKIPTEIDSTEAATPEAPDFAALEARKKEIETRMEEIEAAAANIAERRRLQFEEAARIRTEIGQLKRARQDEHNQAQMRLDQQTNEQNRERRDVQNRIVTIKDQISREQYAGGSVAAKRSQAQDTRNDIERLEREQAARRKEFESIAEQAYNPASLICPRFGHECQDPHACSQGEAAFNSSKAETLKRYRQAGHQANETIAAKTARAEQLEKEADEQEAANEQKLAGLRQQLSQAEARLAGLPEVPRRTLTLADLPGAGVVEAEIAELARKAEQATGEEEGDTEATSSEKAELRAERDRIIAQLGLREVIERNSRTVRGLRGELTELSQEKADLARVMRTADEFGQALTDAAESKVNALFHGVKFRLWKEFINGKRQTDCVALIDGVSYQDANTASRINAGLQVIKAISRHYGLSAPVFVDNCESIGELEAADGLQYIRLRFVNGAPLTVNPD